MMVRLRPATESDTDFVYCVHNDRSMRAQALRSDPIPWSDHVAWYSARLLDPGYSIYIGVRDDGQPIGVVRWEVDAAQRSAELSVAVDPEHRGHGLGTCLIREGAGVALQRDDVSRVVAIVRASNNPSLRAFARAGFLRSGEKVVGGVELICFEYGEGTLHG